MTAQGAGVTSEYLTIAYESAIALEDFSCRIGPGSLTAIAGPNGAGKSTLLKAIVGLVRAASGQIKIDPPDAMIAFLPQQSEVDRGFPITVADVVLFGRWRMLGWHRAATKADWAAVADALAAVGLAEFGRRGIGTLSAGQFQRMLFARLMLQDASIILLDEPFTALDQRTISDLLAIIGAWHAEGRTVIAVLHDLMQIRRYFPQTILLARSLIAAGPTAAVLASPHLVAAGLAAEHWDGAFAATPMI